MAEHSRTGLQPASHLADSVFQQPTPPTCSCNHPSRSPNGPADTRSRPPRSFWELAEPPARWRHRPLSQLRHRRLQSGQDFRRGLLIHHGQAR